MNKLNDRIIIKCKNNLTFAGIYKGIISQEKIDHLILQTDDETKFKIMCPENIIEKIINIPI